MNSEEIMFEQYKLYTEQKEKFVDRSFHTNKFYLLLVLALIFAMFMMKDYSFVYGLTPTLVFSAAGLYISILWWMNMDSYNLIIRVKLRNVIEEIEKSLPTKPYTQEFLSIKDLRKNKRMFLFGDIQKFLAILSFILFFVLLANEVITLIFIK